MAPKEAPVETPAQETPEEWETLRTGLGQEWDFDRDGPMSGTFVEMQSIPVKDWNSDDPEAMRETSAYLFAVNGNDPDYFVWGSAEMDRAMEQVNAGDYLRISFLGVEQFTGDKGPQQIKRYRVQRRKS